MLKPIESQHKPYYLASGEEVPSVTTILKVVNKPFLVGWANRQGLKGIDTSQQGQTITRIGTLVHALIESDLRGEPIDMSGYNREELDIADKSFNRFLDWKIDHEVRPIFLEKALVSERRRYGGTVDAFIELDGVHTIVDWKTSSQISREYFAQLAAYFQMMGENGHNAASVGVLRLPKDGAPYEFESKSIGELGPFWEYFLAAKEMHRAIQSVDPGLLK